MKTQTVEREFIFNNRRYPDPNPQTEPAQVRELLAVTDPDITNSSIEGPEIKEGKAVYRFVRQVGTKG
jgi:PRTRC genetic system protein C